MDCVYPHCTGVLSIAGGSGYCSLCRRPVRACPTCGSWNRTQAALCRTCGKALTESSEAFDPASSLEAEPARDRVDEAIRTMPHSAGGYLWAMGEQGNLYRINPHEREGRFAEVVTRLWGKATAYAFTIGELQRSTESSES